MCKNMVSIINHQGNENQNHTVWYYSTPIRMPIIKRSKITSIADMEKVNPLCTVIGIVKWYSHYRKPKTRTTKWSCNPTLSICTPMFTAALFTESKMWKQPHPWMRIKKMQYQWNITPFCKREENSAIMIHQWNWGHDAKWNKPVTENKYYMIPFMWSI
jgi:hypothetical protein